MTINDKIRKKSGQVKLEEIMRQRLLQWLGHLLQDGGCMYPWQAMNSTPTGVKKKMDDQE